MVMSTSADSREGIEQIREIIIGNVQRDLERRIARVEAHVGARLGELQQEARRRAEVIEGHLRNETDALAARFEGEVNDLKKALQTLGQMQRERDTNIDQRIVRTEEAIRSVQHELRTQILDQAKSFLDQLQSARRELAESVERELSSFELEPEEPKSREPHDEAGGCAAN
jgi:hypothetical protein